MELRERINHISTKQDFADFVEILRSDLINNPNDWENTTLERFLEAMVAYVSAMEHSYSNTGRKMPSQPSWEMLAEILLAAKIYE